MHRMKGFLVSEMVTAVIIVAVVIAVGFGIHVGHQRDRQVERAEASLAAIEARAQAAADGGGPLVCDDSLVDAGVLTNDYLTLSIRPTPIDAADPDAGRGAALFVQSSRERDGNDSFDTARRLLEKLQKADGDREQKRLRGVRNDKKGGEIRYSILASTKALCATPEQDAAQAGAPAT